jgi:DNA topoisomerase-1
MGGETLNPDPVVSAKWAGLRYVSDECVEGIRRVRQGKGFAYVRPDGKAVKDDETLARIRALAIPPAWTGVWICPFENGHVQATGRDVKGRKQHRYHARWRQVRDASKYDKVIEFAKALPKIHAATGRDLRRPGLPREKVLAAVVQLLEKTLIRVGNEEYAKVHKHFGLTTLQDRHVKVRGGSKVEFAYKGKSGVEHGVELEDARLARVIKDCQELPGQDLFQYIDEAGVQRDVTSQDVNDYLRQIAGEEFTAKDFRTWAGTVLAARALQAFETFKSEREAKKNVVRAVEVVAKELGNTKAVCRKCYIHPAILDAYMDGSLVQTLKQRTRQMRASGKLTGEQAGVLGFLEGRLKKEAVGKRAA